MSRLELKCPHCHHLTLYYTLEEKRKMTTTDKLDELIASVKILNERMNFMKIAIENCQYDIFHLRTTRKEPTNEPTTKGKSSKIDF